jgi:putative nucleotidyltransferase with HDIG domain
MLFNFGNASLAAVVSTTTFVALVPQLQAREALATAPFDQLLLPAALAGLLYYAVNHALLSLVRGLAERRSALEVWRADYSWLWPHYALMGLVALILAFAYHEFGWGGLVALVAPVAMMHLSTKQYMDRTRRHFDDLRRLNARLADSYEATLLALSRALDTRDEETEEHSQRVRHYTERLCQVLKVPEEAIEYISRGALLHDIGKIGVPDAVLLKTGALTEAERDLMRSHPGIGYSMIAHIPFLGRASEVVLHHHEAYDGSGYPSGIAGEHIPLGARIFAVVDALDAMTSDRPYRKALSIDYALAEIERCKGTQFDPVVVDALATIPREELVRIMAGEAQPEPGERLCGVEEAERDSGAPAGEAAPARRAAGAVLAGAPAGG